ncbi:ABC transporter permease [Albidovulum sp.]|uniref:ABC transporter permease n=1 Tax=Albidovulum sp. TaxID=1872424 RepID=UPI001D3FA194|nr:ABC transporter permease [Paracoccaceae bacterium]HPE26384.1 ABC transporter permease [Albidovulum sp.]MCB2133846.1 ABC transporter permease [Paracoccaceae bacterium]MCB2143243.1 ABC transporter permease [Paracoccaceae bacterium]MCB2157632.1 ABC transporter permease [Paracoccaceae bacterium]
MTEVSGNGAQPASDPGHHGAFARWFNRRGWADLTIATPYVWLVIFFLVPFLIVVAMSVATRTPTSPPFSFGGEHPLINTATYDRLFSDSLYIRAFLTSIRNAAFATLLCLLIGYPMALGLTRVSKSWRNILLMLVILPFWTSFLLRVYAWMGLMGNNSWFNKLLTAGYNMMMPEEWAIRSIQMMNTNFAVVLVTVYSYLPFMILPLYANLEKLDLTLNEAAEDLGSRPFRVFLDVTLPLSVPGIIAGGLLVFIPASGELIIPGLVGNPSQPMIGRVIQDEFASARDWPMASAVAVGLLLLLVVPMMLYSHFEAKAHEKRAMEP